MSSDSEDMSKPGKKRRFIIEDSSEDSSDDSIIFKNNRKRKTLKVVSDIDSSEEDSDVAISVGRKNGKVKTISTSEDESGSESGDEGSLQLESDASGWQSDWQSTNESDVEEILPKKIRNMNNEEPSQSSSSSKLNNVESDDSDGQSEKCPICLLSFKKQQVATPATCDHCFCLLCLTEWSKNVNTCPVDRQPFTLINVRFQPGGKIVRRIPVEPKNPAEEQIQEDPTFCEVCQQCDREDRMLLCDECDLGYHLECLNPPMEQVPMEEWFCPSCSINRPDLSESVEMDLDELSDIMAEARCLGGTYGRTRSGLPQDTAYPLSSNVRNNPRIIPRTRQTERVRANIRADRRRQLNNTSRNFDPDQPSTSSGIESVYDSYSHSDLVASVIQRVTSAMSRNGRKIKANSTTKSTTKKTRKKRTRKSKKTQNGNGDSVLREVRIREINDDGEEEEIVTYVKVKTSSSSGKRKIKKRTKRTRKKLRRKTTKRRALSSHYGKTVKKRLAITLGMVKGRARLPKLGEQRVGSNVETVRNNNAAMINARFRAGISQVSLFGTNLGLDYSPPGSDDEMILDNPSSNLGSIVGIQRRNVSISSTRRRLALKGVVLGHHNNLSSDSTQQLHPPAIDLLDSIISSQKLWHSKSNKIILKANGTLLLPSNRDNKEENDKNTCNGNSERDPIIKPVVDSNDINNKIEPLNLTNVNSVDIVQAPMYNGSRGGSGGRGGGGGGGGGGNRGNYHGGRYSDSSYSYSGRQNYNNRGSGISPRGGYGQRGPSPIINDFPQNFDNRLSHNFNNSFRFRNNHNYRNDNRPRMPLISNMQRPQNQFRGQNDNSLFTTPPPSFASPAISAQLSAINSPLLINNDPTGNSQEIKSNITTEEPSTSSSSLPVDDKEMNEKVAVDTDEPTGSEASPPPPLEESAGNDEDCDIYSDIESSNNDRSNNEHNESIDDDDNDKKDDGSAADCTAEVLLPPPEPPSELLIDLEENLRNDKESDDEDLIIDDTHKEPEPREIEEPEQPELVKASEKNYYDNSSKYDPFQDADSDDDTQADCPNFSIYSSETMDVARENEQQLSQVIGPLEPPPLPPDMTEEDDHDLSPVSESPKTPELPPPVQLPLPVVDSIDPYVESLRKERQQLSKIPSKKISTDSRGKITFKIGNKTKIMNKLSSLYDEIDDNINVMIEQEKEIESSSVTNQLLTSIDNPKECASFSVGKKDNENSDELFPADGDNVDKTICDHSDGDNVEPSQMFEDDDDDEDGDDNDDKDDKHKLDDPNSSDESERGGTPPIVQMQMKSNSDNCIISESSDVINEEESILSQDFQLEKDENIERKDKNEDSKTLDNDDKAAPNDDNMEVWYSDGAYTPCKDENPILDKDTIESGLEPITPPPKDHNSDDLDRCKTPIGYAGLGTEAISETDEPINFEDEALSSPISNRKDKEIEDGEIIVEDGQSKKLKGSSDSATDDDDCEVKKKKERRDKSNNMEKNKENISSDNNQVSWKKLSKSTKERQYREKMKRRSASKDRNRDRNRNRDHDRLRDYDKDKEKGSVKKRNKSKDRPVKESTVKETAKRKEKRKELPRYDVRKIVAEKPPRPRKDEYGRDIRAIISRSRSRGRSPLRKSHSYSPPRRSWSRNLTRSWSNHRRRSPSRGSRTSSRYSRSHSRCRTRSRTQSRSRSRSRLRSLSRSRSRRKSSITNSRRRSLSRKRSRSLSLRRRRSLSSHRQRKSHQKRLPMRKRKSRSRSRKKDKSKKHKSRSRSRRRKRSWSKSPQPSVRRDKEKKRLKRKCIAGKSRSRDRSASRNWDNVNIPRSLDRGYPIRGTAVNPSVALLQTGIMDKEQINHTSSQNQSSWSGAQWTPSWSRSKSKSRSRSRSRSSAPGGLDTVGPKNLTVILTNKEAIKKKRKEKRLKEGKKRRDGDIERIKKRDKRNRTPPPSKEVFASGDNILVSVCFNNDNSDNLGQISGDKNQTTSSNCNNLTDELADTISSLTSKKRKRRTCREIGMTVSKEQQPSLKKPKKDKAKDKRSVKSPEPKLRNRREKKKKSKAAEIAASKKPVAVIDLDQSPFREQTPSPKDIIVLSDDEDNDSNQLHQQQQNQIHANLPCNLHQQQQKLTDTRQLHDDKTIQEQGNDNDNLQRDEFVGPKTPPEPQIKFSINKQSSNLRASMINPLMDEEEDEDDDDDDDDDGDNDADVDDDDDADDDTNVDNGNNQKNSNDDNIDKGKIDKNDLPNNLLNSNDLSRENELKGNNDNNIIIVGDNNDDELDDLEALELLEMNERTHGSLLQKNDTDNQCELDKHERTEERRNLDELELRLKIGPNTPPDPPTSPPTSPDAYDPFDPTKSRSPTPTASQETSIGIDSGLTSNDSMKLSVIQNKDNFNNDKRDNNDKPKIISMVTIKRAGSPSTTSGNNEKIDDTNKLNSNLSTGNQFTTINPVLATVAAAVQRIGIQRNLTNSQIKQRTSERSNQLPNLISNSVKNITGNFRGSKMNANLNKQNGNELTDNATDTTAAGIGATTIDTSSPYSPGSSLSDGIFDPPPHHQSHNSPPTNIPSNLSSNKNKTNKSGNSGKDTSKKDAFDVLFGSSPLVKPNKSRNKKTIDKRKRNANSKIGVRMDENELQILDDLPSSAVEMQVKDKFLKKLNRQERVVEEVKLVLKPHYTKKHVTKEEYKDIMRKAVPKICHNKSGEINPKKIAQLVEAYVRKCRNNKKKGSNANTSSNAITKNLRPMKTLWS